MSTRNDELFRSASGKLFENARNLRHRLTEAEALLWEKLRSRRLKGLKFRRQHPLDQFIADFYCAEYGVVIELDGGIHSGNESQLYDAARSEKLEQSGIRVIRFSNEEVMDNIHEVLRQIKEFVFSKPGVNLTRPAFGGPPAPSGEGASTPIA